MRKWFYCFRLLPAVLILTAFAVVLMLGGAPYCGPASKGDVHVAAAWESRFPMPRLAPPKKTVFLNLEVDVPELEASWAEN